MIKIHDFHPDDILKIEPREEQKIEWENLIANPKTIWDCWKNSPYSFTFRDEKEIHVCGGLGVVENQYVGWAIVGKNVSKRQIIKIIQFCDDFLGGINGEVFAGTISGFKQGQTTLKHIGFKYIETAKNWLHGADYETWRR